MCIKQKDVFTENPIDNNKTVVIEYSTTSKNIFYIYIYIYSISYYHNNIV